MGLLKPVVLPARVIAYLTAELKKLNFWEQWKGIYRTVYHDEIMKRYASGELEEKRKRWIETPDENKEDGKIIEKAKSGWDITSRNVTHNIGRLKLKRYLSVMANLALRRKYFGF